MFTEIRTTLSTAYMLVCVALREQWRHLPDRLCVFRLARPRTNFRHHSAFGRRLIASKVSTRQSTPCTISSRRCGIILLLSSFASTSSASKVCYRRGQDVPNRCSSSPRVSFLHACIFHSLETNETDCGC